MKNEAGSSVNEVAVSTSSSTTVAERRQSRRTRRRKWAFRGLAVGFPFFALFAINWLLSVVGRESRLIIPAITPNPHNLFCLNPDFEWPYFPQQLLKGPEPRHFVLPKSNESFRIVVVGESSVQGFPYLTEVCFPRQMQCQLERQDPTRHFEVLNAGIVGVNSFTFVDLLRELPQCDPDLVILYAGHNEFYGPGGVASNATTIGPWLFPAVVAFRRTPIGDLLTTFSVSRSPDQQLAVQLANDRGISINSPQFQAAERSYRENLSAIVHETQSHGIPLVVCSVACNLRDQSPLVSLSNDKLSADQVQARDRYIVQAQEFLQVEDAEAALRTTNLACAIDAGHAMSEFRRAQAFEALGKNGEAAQSYSRARDLDGCRFRAPSSFQSIVREVIETANDFGRVFHLDVAAEFGRESAFPAPGRDFFLEHVHFSFDGHATLARVLARFVTERILEREWQVALIPTPGECQLEIGLCELDHIRALTAAQGLLGTAPFNGAPDAVQQAAMLQQKAKELENLLPSKIKQAFNLSSMAKSMEHPLVVVGEGLLQDGDVDAALEYFELESRRRPFLTYGYKGLARCFERRRNIRDAVTCLTKAINIADNNERRMLIEVRDSMLPLLQSKIGGSAP